MQHMQGRFDVNPFQACIDSPLYLKRSHDVALPSRLTGVLNHSSLDHSLGLFALSLRAVKPFAAKGAGYAEHKARGGLLRLFVPGSATPYRIFI